MTRDRRDHKARDRSSRSNFGKCRIAETGQNHIPKILNPIPASQEHLFADP